MAEITLETLLAELETLDIDKQPSRFTAIVAEIGNHVAELPGGLAALAFSMSWQKRCAAMVVAAHLNRPEDVALALGLAGDGHPKVRVEAIRALKRQGDPRAIAALLPRLTDDGPHVKDTARAVLEHLVTALGEAGCDAALLEVPDAVWRPAQDSLDEKAPVPTLKAALKRRADLTADPEKLEEFGRVVRIAEVPPLFERDALLDELQARILGAGARSVVLVGEPGVGKTHVVHALAQRLGRLVPPWLVIETSTSEVMVGTKYIGEWETRLGELIARSRAPRRVLVYFTNVDELSGAGTTSKNDASFLSMLAPYLRRGDVTLVGEASARAVQRGLDRGKGLFQLVNVPEPEPPAVLRILAAQIVEHGRRAGVELLVAPEVQDLIVALAGTYYAGLAEPGRSLKLLGEVVSARLEAAGRGAPVEITADDVVAGLARVSGLPERLLSDKKTLDPGEVREFLEERVLGQREAVDALVDVVTLIKAGLNDPGRPLGVLFFVGPTGVGKTEIAKALAEYIYGSPDRMIRLDLSEYKDYDSYEKLIGGRRARDEGQTLAARMREMPFSVVLLDEIEKAHPNVFDLFLQVFDDGRLTDARGERVDFRQAILVCTSNLGSAFEGGGLGFGKGDGGVPGEERVLREIRRFFRPEFVNRLGKIIVFKALDGDVMRRIVRRELGRVLLRSGILRRRLVVDVDARVIDLLLEQGFSPEFGARPLKRRVQDLVLAPLARAIVALGPEDHGALLRLTVDGDRVTVRRRSPRPAAAPPERLRLKRPEDERVVVVRPSDLPAMVEALAARVSALAARAAEERLAERKSEIVEKTAAPSFWDDATRARRLLADMVHLEEQLEGLERVRRRVEGLSGFARSAARQAGIKGRFEQAHAECVDDLVRVEHLFFGERPEDRRDAFLVIRRVGADGDAAEAADLLARAYASWAERAGFALTWLSRREDAAVALVEGRSIFGLLRGEEGLHRFEGGGKGADRRAAFARVEVIARPDGEGGLARRDVSIRRRGGEASATHAPSGTTVETDADVADELLLELLEAEVSLRARRPPDAEDRLVRRYGIEGRFAVDEDSGIRLAHKEILGGGLDELLRARLFRSA